MSLALFVMIQYAGLAAGFFAGMERNILDLETGDLQVFAPGYRDKPSLYTRVEDPEPFLRDLERAGYRASARLLAGGLAAGEEASAGVTLLGVDIPRDMRVSRIHEQLLRGDWLDASEPHGAVLGRRLAHTLGVGPGDEIVVLTQGADGSMANELYRVRGVLKNVGDRVDRTGVFLSFPAFRELMVLPAGAHQIIVRRPDGIGLDPAADRVRELAGELDVKSWKQLLPTLASMLDSTQGVMYVMFLIFYTAVGILMLNAMLMAVFERIREFGVLKALGVGPGGVLGIIVTEVAIQTGLAILVGGLLSVPAGWYLSVKGIDMSRYAGVAIAGVAWDPVWRSAFRPETLLGPILTLLGVVSLAVLYPALKAAMIQPVDAIHHR
jgi:ABC-type lipoprotein release transport system permease subunit